MNENKNLKKNTLWAKILVVILTIFIIWLSLYKFSLYLSEPKVLFASSLKSFNDNFRDVLNDLADMSFFGILHSSGVEINSDIKVDSSNLLIDSQNLDNIINSLNFTSNIRIDKSNNYFSSKIKMRKDSLDKMNLDYLITDGKKYIQSSNINDNYIKLENRKIDLFDIEKENILYISNILKEEIIKFLEDKKFYVKDYSIAVNNKTVDCNKISYQISNKDLNTLIENVVYELQSNSEVIKYLAYLLGEDTVDFNDIVNQIKSTLEIDYINDFEIAIYVSQISGDSVRLEISSLDGSSKVLYNKDYNFKQIEIVKNGTNNSIILEGSLKNTFVLTLKYSGGIVTVVSTKKDEGREGKVKTNDFDCEFYYMIKPNNGGIQSLSANLYFDFYNGDNPGKLNLSISSLINENIDIDEIVVKEFIKSSEFEKSTQSTLNESIIEAFKNINLETPLTGNFPVVFTD